MESELLLLDAERLQQDHYDRIGHEYNEHYCDKWSLQYREEFICRPMFARIELENLKVLDAMCGRGPLTRYLLARGASVTGLDISSTELDAFQKLWPTCGTICASALDSRLANESFDCVAIVGGLHHLHPNVHDAVREFHRILKPGGYFCFAEPHAGSLPELVRRQWYKRDSLFADNEAGIDLRALKNEFSSSFVFRSEIYSGNLGYLLVLNSMVFRIPLSINLW